MQKFANDRGAKEIRIPARAFECIGATPPFDHPHIFLDMGEAESIVCPYCSTRYRFEATASPAGSDSAAQEAIL